MFTSRMFTSGNARPGYAELGSLITIDYLLTSRNQAKSQATLQATLRREACLLKVSKAQIAPWAIANLAATNDVSVSMEPGNSPQSRFSPADPSSQALIGFPLWLWLLLPFLGLLLLILLRSRRQSVQQRNSPAEAPYPGHPPSSKQPEASNSTINSLMESLMEETSNLPDSANLPNSASITPEPTSNTQQESSTAEQEVLSVIQEEVSVSKQQVERGKIRVNKRVESREEIVNAPIVHEQVVVERVPCNQVIEGEIPTERHENGVHIIPIFEEVAVAEKHLVLREEVHISKKLVTANAKQAVAVQRGVVDIERTAFESEPSNQTQAAIDSQTSASISPEAQLGTATAQKELRSTSRDLYEAETKTVAVPESRSTERPVDSSEEALAVVSSAQLQANQPQTPNRVSNREAIAEEEIVVPIMAEEAALTVQQIARGKVQVRTRFDTVEQIVEAPVMREELIIEHIPRNQSIQGDLPQIREENGVQIIPILEEVLVSRKQLLLREEVRISKRRVTENIPQAITLRYEVADIEQISFEDSSE